MSRTYRKFVSVLLSAMMLAMIIQAPLNITAADLPENNNTENETKYEQSVEKESISNNEFVFVPTVNLSEIVSQHDIEKYGHVGRAKEYESTLNSVEMRNADGTMTTYIFSEDIKYIDDEGVVRDKGTSVTTVTDKVYEADYEFTKKVTMFMCIFQNRLTTIQAFCLVRTV